MSKRGNLEKDAFTLIELLLYIGLMGVILLISSQFINITLKTKVKGQLINEVEQQGDQITYLLSQNIKASSAINSPATGTSSTTLSLASNDPARNPTVFKLASTSLVVSFAGGSNIELNNSRVKASDLIFYNLSNASSTGSLSASFSLGIIDPYNRSEYSYSERFNVSASRRY
ncbi:MAG: hypothetical protein WC441_02090 [Patescibacteria group bacterium]